jgi:hypothetical protein
MMPGRVRSALACLLLAALLGAGCAAREAGDTGRLRVTLDAPTRVPIRIVQNITLVEATLNRVQSATLIVDTGAQSTIISPALVKRLGVVVADSVARRQVTVVGGSKLEVPFVKLALLRVGSAKIENLEIGVYDVAPRANGIHGLLGADFLHQFRMTLDRHEGLMHLEPLRR